MISKSSISKRLQEAEERAVVLNILSGAKQEIGWNTDSSPVLEAIIVNINKIVKHLTQNEISSHVDICFSAANPLYAVPLLVSKLSIRGDSTDRIIFWLTASIREGLERTLKETITADCDDFLYEKYAELVDALVFLRDKLLNAVNKDNFRFRTPDSLRIIENSLCSAVTSSLEHVYESVMAETDVDLRVLSLLIAKSRTIVLMETTLLRYIIRWICSRERSAIWDRIAQRIFTDESLGTRDAEVLIIEVALTAVKEEDLMRCFGLFIRRNPIVHRVCCTKLFLQRVCDPALVVVLAGYIHTAATNEIYVQTIKAAVSVWSDPSHVRYVAIEQQMHLTRVILALGRWINDVCESTVVREVFDIVIQGVEVRLANPEVTIRQSGMFVGEAFSGWMGGEWLEFEHEETPWLAEMRRIRDGAPVMAEAEESDGVEEPPVLPQCDDIQLPSSSSCAVDAHAVDSDDDEDFPAYEVPESEKHVELPSKGDEPEIKVPAPSYIRECMEHLDEKEKYEVFEAAFFALNGMIRRKALGFVDISSKLVKKLVFLENKFSTKGFEEYRKQCVVSCLVMRPELAPKLGDMVFSRNSSFFHRYLILECFVAAAKELSEFSTESSSKKVIEVKKKVEEPDDWRAVVEARIRSHTRRFTSEPRPEVTAPSRFAPVATMFFYPLLRTQTEEHLELKGRDSPFLARLIFCASDILQKAAYAPSVVKMATALADVVAPLRFHPDAFVRSSVLFAYFSITVAVPDAVFFEMFGNLVRSWMEWTTMCADNVDASEQQRNLARGVTATLLRKLEGTNTIEESANQQK